MALQGHVHMYIHACVLHAGYPTVWSSRIMCTCTYMYTYGLATGNKILGSNLCDLGGSSKVL